LIAGAVADFLIAVSMLYFARTLFWQIYPSSEAVLTVDINRKKGCVE
jgi:hypothetical protein